MKVEDNRGNQGVQDIATSEGKKIKKITFFYIRRRLSKKMLEQLKQVLDRHQLLLKQLVSLLQPIYIIYAALTEHIRAAPMHIQT